MTSEGLEEIFEGDSADTCGEKIPLVSLVAERRVESAQTRKRGPPSAPAEISKVAILLFWQQGHMQSFRTLGKPLLGEK